MTNETNKNPFDFNDVSDLPEELASKLFTDTNASAKEYAAVVDAGAEAGHSELTINQIIAASTRMGMDVPTQQTVRNYLNKAVDMGLIQKPSRQTYGAVVKGKKSVKAEDVVSNDPVVTQDMDTAPATDDPLAGI